MLSQLHENRNFEIEGNINENTRWPIEEHDFNELVGNLADNAGKWAHHRITVQLQESDSDFRLIVSDDGPGVEPSEHQSLGRRGLRLDEQTPGHGLGLAIVRDIAGHYDGFLDFSESPEGGLQVTVSIPRHRSI
jgi:signal transduction histidine kinase